MKFERLETLSDNVLMEILPEHLNQIEPGLRILAEKLSLSKDEKPFMLVVKGNEKRIGIIEVLDDEAEFPGKVLSHAGWVAANRTAISGLKNEPVEFDLLPFVICLVRETPAWRPLCSYLNIDISLVKFQSLSFQGTVVLLLEPIGKPSKILTQPVPPPFPPRVEKVLSRFSTPETVNEMGLTETEVRYFTT